MHFCFLCPNLFRIYLGYDGVFFNVSITTIDGKIGVELETERYRFFETIPIIEVKYGAIISGISYHCIV